MGYLECDAKCQQSNIDYDLNNLNVPLVAITASNPDVGCKERNLEGHLCDNFMASHNASLNLTLEQAKLSPKGSVEYCPGICEHDLAWAKADYVHEMIEKYLPIML
jgi:hypothetical protein